MQFPSQFTDVADPDRSHPGSRTNIDLLVGSKLEGLVADIVVGQLLEHHAGLRTADVDDRMRGGDIIEIDRAVFGHVHPHPVFIMDRKSAPGDDVEPVLG